MDDNIRNFIQQFNKDNNTVIKYNIKDNILTISQSGIVSLEDNLRKLKELILINYPTEIIEFINEEKGYCEEYPEIELLAEVKFKLKPIEYIINQLQQIQTDNLRTCIYYENIKNTGKNILLLGERHMITDVQPITNFFDLLIQYKGDNCLDFFLEDNFRYLRDTHISNPDSINIIREYFRRIDKYGVRKHFMNNRMGTEDVEFGFLKTLHNIFSHNLKINLYNSLFNKISDEGKFHLFVFLCNLKDRKEYKDGEKLCFEILSDTDLISQPTESSNNDSLDKIIRFITGFQIKDLEGFYTGINENYDSIQENDRSFFENINTYRYLDDKFSKQINEIDTTFFTIEELLNFFRKCIENQKSFLILLFDVFTIARMFRKFNFRKERIIICDSEEKSLKNIVLYNGDSHNLNINDFIEEVILKNNRNEINKCRKIYENYIPKFNYFNFFNK